MVNHWLGPPGCSECCCGNESPGPEEALALRRLRAASPDFVLGALGSPKQEIWIHRISRAIYPSVARGVRASFDFITGRVRRAPRWMVKSGLEWVFGLPVSRPEIPGDPSADGVDAAGEARDVPVAFARQKQTNG